MRHHAGKSASTEISVEVNSSSWPGASIVGGAKLVEFLSDGSPCVSY